MDNVNVLLISFYFPPYNRVGGRRWAKHCKYLKREGFNINVLCKNFENSTSSWDKDTFEYKKSITRIKLQEIKTPYFKKELPKTILSKICA